MDLQKTLAWRYATKKFDPTKKIPKIQIDELLESLRMAPSSFGFQPWKFLVITDQTVKQSIMPLARNQQQVADCSHLIVLCVSTDIDEKRLDDYVRYISHARDTSVESLKGFKDRVMEAIIARPIEDRVVWATGQVYIALGFILLAAAEMRIDACPMEGFDKKKVDDLLDLGKDNLRSVALCPLGYRANDDKYAMQAKVRFPASKVFKFI
ncbi:MAG: NAD(P)H-dependent oxidoreductase [Nanoarchaeota archaeon]|mgnify:FL=1